MREDEQEETIETEFEESYEPPAVVESARFETVAQACAYVGGSGGLCNINPSGG